MGRKILQRYQGPQRHQGALATVGNVLLHKALRFKSIYFDLISG
jgi:hypothetical protein